MDPSAGRDSHESERAVKMQLTQVLRTCSEHEIRDDFLSSRSNSSLACTGCFEVRDDMSSSRPNRGHKAKQPPP